MRALFVAALLLVSVGSSYAETRVALASGDTAYRGNLPKNPNSGAYQTESALEFCNDTQSHIGIAFGYEEGHAWVSEGWWNVDPGACETVLNGTLEDRFYYFHAVDYDNGGFWGGYKNFCILDKLFTIRDLENCGQRGYVTAGFFEVDTGDQDHWTVNLSGEKTSETTKEAGMFPDERRPVR